MNKAILASTLTVTLLWSTMFIEGIQHANVSIQRKLLAYITLVAHDYIVLSVFVVVIFLLIQSVIYSKFYYRDVLIVNVVFLIIFISFTYYKMCVLTIFYNYLLDNDKCLHYYSFYDFLAKQSIKVPLNKDRLRYDSNVTCSKNFGSWLEGTRLISLLILALNMVYIFK